ncbi:MAG: DM13 domain-containing protein [Fimbriimonadaceae bacterium]|nr:DM13 domain-containing protein [Fimbriimonadaceae bacterium]QYK56799.1 MAG: DM13 domain-containing protein [Fimbriimonadaceae bacterium]
MESSLTPVVKQKKLIALGIAIPAAAICWALFRPELLFVNQEVNEKLAVDKILASGSFDSYAHETKGTAKLVESDGTHYLRLDGFHTSNGPDVRVYLVKDSDAGKGANAGNYVDLGSIKGNIGSQNYKIPSTINPGEIKSIAIWCKRFNVGFGGATLTKAQ